MLTWLKKVFDDEAKQLAVGIGIFTVALVILDASYSKFWDMIKSWYVIPVLITHAAIVYYWLVVIKNFNSTDSNKFRWRLAIVSVIALIVVASHRAGFISDKMFWDEVNKNKIENTK